MRSGIVSTAPQPHLRSLMKAAVNYSPLSNMRAGVHVGAQAKNSPVSVFPLPMLLLPLLPLWMALKMPSR